jgi:hypothetical protein
MILDPECYSQQAIFFVRSSGTYLPCCYSSTNKEFEKFLGPELYDQLNLTKYSLEEIRNSEAWSKIRGMIESDDPIPFCRTFCTSQRDKTKDLAGNEINRLIVE